MTTDIDRRYPGLPDYERASPTPLQPIAEALDFAEETVREAQRGRRWAWTITTILILICAAQAGAIALMLPLKDVVPYTIVVDRQTGYMETVRGLELGPLKDDAAVVHSALAQYVLQRETFDPADFEERYKRVALWSTGAAQQDYIASYAPGAPGSVLSDVRPGTIIAARVKNIEVLDQQTARVRFDLTRRDPGAAPVTADWQSLISFRFTGSPLRMEDRLINPLGFQVTSYRRDAEYAAPAVAEAPPPVAPAADDTNQGLTDASEPATTPAVQPPAPASAPSVAAQKRLPPAPAPVKQTRPNVGPTP
jgi:type IV secretion system protein VirB8